MDIPLSNFLEELPLDSNNKFDILKQNFADIDDVLLHKISNFIRIAYLVKSPRYEIFLIESGKLISKANAVSMNRIDGVINDKTNRLFCLYEIVDDHLRGNWIYDFYKLLPRIRDYKINKIIDL